MCGIVGYTGADAAKGILVDGLKRLEYRGYDSSGVALEVSEGGTTRLDVTRRVGKVAGLESELANLDDASTCGIGHTRWATHGRPSVANAHPHASCDGRIAVVHNGIVENFQELREELEGRGHTFRSETDTEVFAHLIEDAYAASHDLMAAVRDACSHVVGAYGLAVVCADEPGVIAVARKDSPIVIGMGERGAYVASDVIALIGATRDVVMLEDGQYARLTPAGITYTDEDGAPIEPDVTHIDWDIDMAEKGGYPDFMLKEIHEEPAALKKTFSAHVDAEKMAIRPGAFPISAEEANSLRTLTIVACGTAYHAGVVGKYVIEKLARLPVVVDVASEFRYRNPILGAGDCFLAISQSGETADTLAAMREAERLGAKVMALTNVVGSSIARTAGDCVMYTYAGPEIAVASTKAYITQVEMMVLLAIDLGVKRGHLTESVASELLRQMADIPALAEQVMALEPAVQRFSSLYHDRQHVFYIGRGLDNALAMEASLKLKEVSYIMSEAYAAGELKHGTIALIEQGTLVCALLTQEHLADKTLSNVREVKSRGAKVLIVCPEALRDRAAKDADELWVIPDTASDLLPLLAIIPVQLFAYYMAVSRGCDVDKPRNLAKSVTVE